MIQLRYIVHVDMDAFFAAVEQRDNPTLAGKPVIIGADPKNGKGRGVVSTCSYAARRFGVRSAMPISEAFRLCPQGIFLPPDMKKYSAVSQQILEIFDEFTPDVEPVSIDEAFLDITATCERFGGAVETCKLIKQRIRQTTGLTASVGLAPNKMAAKIASDLEKPDGFVQVPDGKVKQFLAPLDTGRLWGLGKKAKTVLAAREINTIGDIAKLTPQQLVSLFGKNGEHFWKLANGIDERQVEREDAAKSLSAETTFEHDTSDENILRSALMGLCERLSARLRLTHAKSGHLSVKIRLAGFETYTRGAKFFPSTNFTEDIYKEVLRLFAAFPRKGKKVRLLGVRAADLLPADENDTLFPSDSDGKKEKIHAALDSIREKFGHKAVRRASSLPTEE